MAKPRLAIVTSHPIQYQSPLFRQVAQRGKVHPTVLYLSDHGIVPSMDPGFHQRVRFDTDLLGGFDHRYLPNRSPWPSVSTPAGLMNPALLSTLRPTRFDAVLVHGHAHVSTWMSFLAARSSGLPYMLRGESHALGKDVPRAKRIAKHLLLDPVVQGAAACLAIGSHNADFYRSHGAADYRIVPSPYCVDNAFFAKRGRDGRSIRPMLLSAIGLNPRLPTVLFAAKLVPRKRPFDLVMAHRSMRQPANLVVIGDGQLAASLAEAAGDERVRLTGFKNQHELGLWYGAADVFVLPSSHETWGLAVNEAMAAGTVPVVSDAVGCAPDLVEATGGRTFPVGDTKRLAEVLDQLVNDPPTLARLRSAGRAAVDRHSLDAAATGIEAAVEIALSSQGDLRHP